MRVAVLSDIHSNYHAFRACYEDAIKYGTDSFVFLGDYVSDLSEPQKTMDLVYEIQSKYPTICLRGNREGYMLDCRKGASSFARGSKSGSLLFTYDHLRDQDFDFFKDLKIADTIEMDGVQIEIAHAALDNDRYYFDSKDGRIGDIFAQMKCNICLRDTAISSISKEILAKRSSIPVLSVSRRVEPGGRSTQCWKLRMVMFPVFSARCRIILKMPSTRSLQMGL